MAEVIGDLLCSEVERLEVRFELWTPTRVQGQRATVDWELIVAGELLGLTWALYEPQPTGTVREVVHSGLRRVVEAGFSRS